MSNEDVMVFLKESLPGVILALHDISSKRRREAKLTLRALCERANEEPALQEPLVSATVACLAGASETIRAGVVEALGLYAYCLEDCESLKERFARVVLLLDNLSPQMARSVVKFLRLSIQGIRNDEIVQELFQFFLKAILGSSVARAACRIRIRTLVEKLGKKFGWDKLEKMIPEAHIKLFRYTRRMYNRRVRKCQEKASKETMDDDSEFDSSDEENEEVCLQESADRPIDLSSNRLPIVRKRRVSQATDSIKLSSDGKMIVEESDLEEEAPVKKRVSLSDLAELRNKADAVRKAKMVEQGSSKMTTRSKKAAVETKRNRRRHELIGLTQFAPRKAHAFGDAKRSAADTDPFAYVRLNPSLVREKYRGNALSALSQVIRKTGEKSVKKRGRNGVSGNLFVQKPSFKKQRPVKSSSRK
jgi:hypothetical protein